MTYYNFKSIFAWNIILYTGFMGFVAIYLWTMMDRAVRKYYKLAGFAAFIWRLILTTGTGSIFGFLVGRQGYDAAIMAPMFVVMSFSFGLAIFLLVLMAAYDWTGRPLGEALLMRLKNLLGVFVAGALYFVIVFHLTNLYATEHHDWEKFILMGESVHTKVFWLGQVLLGSLVPLGILYSKAGRSRAWIAVASALVILGGFATMWVTIIGGQSFPLVLFPGMEVVSSGYFDDVAYHTYSPSFPELVLGLGGVAVALIAVVVAVKVLNLLPSSLADADVDPHHKG